MAAGKGPDRQRPHTGNVVGEHGEHTGFGPLSVGEVRSAVRNGQLHTHNKLPLADDLPQVKQRSTERTGTVVVPAHASEIDAGFGATPEQQASADSYRRNRDAYDRERAAKSNEPIQPLTNSDNSDYE
jgi:hypothetical protein